ncbi:MAG TPA: twin-arginine translocase subunit TatC [Streptosporangiaceae bacterium]|nr:twin-arginine translocase subunit TatC [Streptosporangiaceae bacterium]
MARLPGAIQGARIVGERYVRSQRQQNPEGRMPLFDHLRELRNRVVKSALALVAGMIVGFVFFNPVWNFIQRPLCDVKIRGHEGCHTLGVNQLVLNGPLDAFYLRVKVALIVGVILSSPIWLYQIWSFIAPGLYARETRWGYYFLGTAVPLFLVGNVLAYLSLGRSMHYLLGLTPGNVSNLIQVDLYISFVMTIMLAFGIAFELPLLIIMLNLAGILTHERFRKWRRMLIFGTFLIAGIANPSPDPITMLILGGACALLVEVAEFIVWSNDRRRARRHPDPYAGLADDELSPLDLGDSELDVDDRPDSRLN